MNISLYDLPGILRTSKIGFQFYINHENYSWIYEDENKYFFFIKNNISKQRILLQKPD